MPGDAGIKIAFIQYMKNQKHEPKKKKNPEPIIQNASQLHDFLWEKHERKENRRKRSANQYSTDYLVETIINQNRNPFDYH